MKKMGIKIKNHFMTFHFSICHSYFITHGEILFSKLCPRIKKMGDSLEAQINTVEHIQEEFGHDIQEMKRQLARLTKLIERRTGIMPENIHGSPPFPLQLSLYPLVHHPHPNHEPYIPIVINVSPRVHRPNWQPHTPTSTIIPSFKKMSLHVDQASGSRNNLEKSMSNTNKNR